MSDRSRPGQFQVTLSDGLRVDRLPIGLAADRLWVAFVFSGTGFGGADGGPVEPWGRREISTLAFEGPQGPLAYLGSAGGGGRDLQHSSYEFDPTDLPWIRIHYLDAGARVASETVVVEPDDR